MRFSTAIVAAGLVALASANALPGDVKGDDIVARGGGGDDHGNGRGGDDHDNHGNGGGGRGHGKGGKDTDCKITTSKITKTSVLPSETSTTSPSTTSTVPSSTPSQCTYLGCYADPLGFPSRVLTFNSQVSEEAQTIETCQATCLALGLKYAGLEYTFECWCGDVLHNSSPPTIDPAQCTYPCSGNATQTCGGQEYMDLYDCSALIPPPPIVNDCKPLGCYTDSVSGRTLLTSVEGGDDNQSPTSCTAACIALGFRFAGTEYGRECWCADSLASTGIPAPDGNEQCDMPCAGDATQKCGGKDRLNLYDCEFPIPTPSETPSGTPSGTSVVPTVTSTPTSPPCPPKLVNDFHSCFKNNKHDSLKFCHEWLDVTQADATTTTKTVKNRWAARHYGNDNDGHDNHNGGGRGSYGGKLGNERCKKQVWKWPKLEWFQDDEVDRACRCHVGQWWSAPVVTKTVYH